MEGELPAVASVTDETFTIREADGRHTDAMFAETLTDVSMTGGIQPHASPRRRASRVSLVAEVTLRRSGQNNYRVTVYDISPEGCRVEFVERPSLNEVLWVKFGQLEALEARVCWTRGPLAGLRFARPIYPAVFDMLLLQLS